MKKSLFAAIVCVAWGVGYTALQVGAKHIFGEGWIVSLSVSFVYGASFGWFLAPIIVRKWESL